MTQYAITAWDLPSVPVAGTSQRFPVRHIYCVGRNYAEHAKEMGGDATKEPPFFFTKPADAVVPVRPGEIGRVAYPLATKNYHHEIEMVVAIGKAGVGINAERALDHVYGYATGLDMTRRDLQDVAKQTRRPWDTGKSFAQAAPIGVIVPASRGGHRSRGAITLDVGVAECRRRAHHRPATISIASDGRPSTCASRRSPATTAPTPDGVPV